MPRRKQAITKYIYAIGRRKRSVATVRMFAGKGESLINEKKVSQIYSSLADIDELNRPFVVTETVDKYHYTAKISGGGRSGQRDAIQLAIARALLKVDEDYRKTLKSDNLLTRDPREKERKKPGLKKARKKEQYSKR